MEGINMDVDKQMEIVRQRIVSLPEVLHMPEKEIAKAMGTTLQTYRKRCTEIGQFKIEYLINLTENLPITMNYLIGCTEFPYPMTEDIAKLINSFFEMSEKERKQFNEEYMAVEDDYRKIEFMNKLVGKKE